MFVALSVAMVACCCLTVPTAFLAAAQARGARIQGGADMLFEQIPAYLEFFGLPTTTPDALRTLVF